jgi:hypothetical protein
MLKDDLQLILDGVYNDVMPPEQVKMALELSFLFNHLTHQGSSFIFKYGDIEIASSYDSDYIPSEEAIMHTIITTEAFKRCLTQFIRDNKISNLLN